MFYEEKSKFWVTDLGVRGSTKVFQLVTPTAKAEALGWAGTAGPQETPNCKNFRGEPATPKSVTEKVDLRGEKCKGI